MFGKRKQMETDIQELRDDMKLANDRVKELSKMVGKESAARVREDMKLKNTIGKIKK